MTVSVFALSGGGSRGDFEVGALQYLYEQDIRPALICGTSVGSINGAKLAEGEGTPTSGLAGLLTIWQSLQSNSDLWQWEEWVEQVDPQHSTVVKALLREYGLFSPLISWINLFKNNPEQWSMNYERHPEIRPLGQTQPVPFVHRPLWD